MMMVIMNKNWKLVTLRQEFQVVVLLILSCQSLVCWSLNEEGMTLFRLREKVVNDTYGALSDWKEQDGEVDHCSWFGVECSDGKLQRGLLQQTPASSAMSLDTPFFNFSMPPSPHGPANPTPASSNASANSTYLRDAPPVPRPSSAPASKPSQDNTVVPNAFSPLPSGSNPSSSNHQAVILGGSIGGAIFLLIVIIAYLLKTSKVSTVKPWATGLSGQIQKAFVTGVPKLKRSEIEAACEDFCNVIGTSSVGTVYKGTLSNGIEIAVVSVAVKSSKDWSKNLTAKFRKQIDMLSKVNHKNFLNLLGYCEEDKPFTRMMVFEYAPNGTLFEHLHIKESEHLDWGMRLRIVLGMAYCLEHMHQLNPPVPHNNLSSSAVNLTEDYASKISDQCFWNELTSSEREADRTNLSDISVASLESNVYTFGVLLFEIVTGRMPYLVDNGSSDDGASDYLRREQALIEMVDPTLNSFDRDQLDKIGEVMKSCVDPEPGRRPDMSQVSARLREITAITHDNAIPKLSPLWWAELEIMSAEAS